MTQHRKFLALARVPAERFDESLRPALDAQLDLAERMLVDLNPLTHPDVLAPAVPGTQAGRPEARPARLEPAGTRRALMVT
ncbi:MAG: hypothetical protein LC808_37845 [Actinobacteria bacterium]|nr:hypothetical protein [Actinomycetota bacterium]